MTYEAELCRSCSAPVIWAVTPNAKSMPVDVEPTPAGNLELTPRGPNMAPRATPYRLDERAGRTDLHTSHFVTCPHAAGWRRR